MANLKKFNYKYLFDINSPADLRELPVTELPRVCDEVREYLIETITKTGGHFGAGLGVVELTVALHYVYDTPADKLIWDVGHQGYPHKIITGRRDQLHTIRQKGGLSGFLKPTESEYDTFGAGHASTSISAALGMAAARDIQEDDYRVVSVIGDGAMTGGLAFEAMNNCGVQKRNLTVVLNDNDASIAPNVSALSNYFNEVFASTPIQKIRDNIWDLTGKMDELGDRIRFVASRFEKGFKSVVTPGMLFEAFGFKYFGPNNGNNVQKLVRMFNLIKEMNGPILLHTITKKGYGYPPAEKDPKFLHAIGKIDKDSGKAISTGKNNKPKKYQKVFGEAMIELCKMNPKIVGITAAMPDGTSLDIVQEEFPERIFDVGIAEGHAVTFAAGLAKQGMKPVCAIYSTFLQRAYDHIVHDVALQKLPVVFALDRGGLVGADGATHHGVLDIAYLRVVQGMILMAPTNEQELRDMLYSAIYHYKSGPAAIRYPRGEGLGVKEGPMKEIPLGKSQKIREGDDIAILGLGKMLHEAVKAAEELEKDGVSAEVINPRFVKPIDGKMLDELAVRFDRVITVEDAQAIGGFGSAVLENYAQNRNMKFKPEVHILGIPDKIIQHGTQEELHHELGLDAAGIASYVRKLYNIPEKVESEAVHSYK